MDSFLDNVDSISFEGNSRSARWDSLRNHLKHLIQITKDNNDKLARLEKEVAQIREVNLKVAEAIETLSNLANEEVQREISLTLNDTDGGIAINAIVQESIDSDKGANEEIKSVPFNENWGAIQFKETTRNPNSPSNNEIVSVSECINDEACIEASYQEDSFAIEKTTNETSSSTVSAEKAGNILKVDSEIPESISGASGDASAKDIQTGQTSLDI